MPDPPSPEGADSGDPVVEAYKKAIDRTLLRECLKLTVEERIEQLMRWQQAAQELRDAMRRAGRG